MLYGASCGFYQFSHNYPFAFGPRLGGQTSSRSIRRPCCAAAWAFSTMSPKHLTAFCTARPTTIKSIRTDTVSSPLQNTANPAQNGLQGGNAYAAGNPFGNAPVVWPNLNQDKYPFYNNGIGAPGTPAIFIDPPQSSRAES